MHILGDVLYKTKNSYIRTDGKLVAVIGVDDLVIVSTKDVLVVAHKDRVQDVKAVAQELKAESRTEWEHHREVLSALG